MQQAEAELPYYPLEDLTWTANAGGGKSNNIPVRNGIKITATGDSFQVHDVDNSVRLVGYTKNYTVLPEVTTTITIWFFKNPGALTVEYLESINLVLEYL